MDTHVDIENETDISLTLTREFDAPRERVFEAWTDPAQLMHWMGPEGIHVPDITADVKVGGEYIFPMVSKDTGGVHTVKGNYTTIDRPSALSFTWSWVQEDGSPGQLMTVALEFAEINGKTKMTMVHKNFIDEDAKAHHKSGWDSTFDCLEASLSH